MSMVWTAILADSLAQIPILDFQLFETTSSGSRITPIPSRVSSPNLKVDISRPGVEAFMMIVLPNMIQHLRMFITRITLGRGPPCKVCIWLGVAPIGATVSNDQPLRLTTALTRAAAAPVVYSSYDYSAPLRETRQIQDKLYQTKLVGLFTRVSGELLKTYMVGNGTGFAVCLVLSRVFG
jgi:hypothetical protein